MPTVVTTVHITQPPAIIAAALLDPENAVFWTSDLEKFEVIERTPDVVGSVAHLHYRQGTRRYVMEDVMEDYIPNRYFKSRVTGMGLTAKVETWLEPTNAGTDLKLRWAGFGTNLPMRILMLFARRSVQRQMRGDLEKFKALVERDDAHFSDEPLTS